MYPCDAPPLGVAAAFVFVRVILGKHGALWHLRRIEGPAAKDARGRRVHHRLAGAIVTGRGGVHGGSRCGRDCSARSGNLGLIGEGSAVLCDGEDGRTVGRSEELS